jgi:hypothetical protein
MAGLSARFSDYICGGGLRRRPLNSLVSSSTASNEVVIICLRSSLAVRNAFRIDPESPIYEETSSSMPPGLSCFLLL